MKIKKVISANNLPTQFNLWPILTTILALDHWNAVSWMWWVAIGLLVIVYIVNTVKSSNESPVDFFEEDKPLKNSFKQKMDDIRKAQDELRNMKP